MSQNLLVSFESHTSSKKPQNANCKTHGTIYPWLNRHNCKLLLCDHLNGVWTALNKNSNDLESITEALGVHKKPQTSEYMQLAWCHKHYVFAIAIRNCNGRMNSMNSLGNQWVFYELRHSIDVATGCSVLWSNRWNLSEINEFVEKSMNSPSNYVISFSEKEVNWIPWEKQMNCWRNHWIHWKSIHRCEIHVFLQEANKSLRKFIKKSNEFLKRIYESLKKSMN